MVDLSGFVCLLCDGGIATYTGKHPRDREDSYIVACSDCGHVQMFPLLTEEEEQEEYNEDKSLRFGKVKIADGSDFKTMRTKFAEWTEEHFKIYFDALNRFDNVLEIGAGYGFFMELCNKRRERKFNIEGIEIGRFRLENFVGGTVHNVNILKEEIPSSLRHKFDCVICMHVLEHIRTPVEFLERVKGFLKPGGVVIFEVPNLKCLLAELSTAYADFMYLYEHCSYFTADTLRFVFEKAKYNIIDIYTREIYSIENHCRWIREGTPFTKYNQMYLPDPRIEWINDIYKTEVGKGGKGFLLVIEAKID